MEGQVFTAMYCSTTKLPPLPVPQGKDVLSHVLRLGAQRLLDQAIEGEVASWIDGHNQLRASAGHRRVVRSGFLPRLLPFSGV